MKRFIIIMLAGILLLTVGCSSKKKENLTVRIAYFSNITHSQALVMKQKKSLEQKLGDTCQVVWYNFNAGPQEVEAMFADEIDLGYIGPVPAINANVKSNGDIRIIANACDAGAVLIKSRDAAIHTIADLDKKTVAVPQLGNTQHLCLLNLLTENGLAAKSDGGSVDVVAVNNADMPGMLEQGKIDAALVPEPWGSIMEEQCDAQLVLDYNKIFLNGNYPSTVIIVNNDFYKQHKDIVRVFLETHNEITTYINNHKDEAFEIINHQIEQATGVKYDSKIINKAYQRLSITDKISEKAIKKLGEIGVEQGFISKLPSDSIIYTSILDDLK